MQFSAFFKKAMKTDMMPELPVRKVEENDSHGRTFHPLLENPLIQIQKYHRREISVNLSTQRSINHSKGQIQNALPEKQKKRVIHPRPVVKSFDKNRTDRDLSFSNIQSRKQSQQNQQKSQKQEQAENEQHFLGKQKNISLQKIQSNNENPELVDPSPRNQENSKIKNIVTPTNNNKNIIKQEQSKQQSDEKKQDSEQNRSTSLKQKYNGKNNQINFVQKKEERKTNNIDTQQFFSPVSAISPIIADQFLKSQDLNYQEEEYSKNYNLTYNQIQRLPKYKAYTTDHQLIKNKSTRASSNNHQCFSTLQNEQELRMQKKFIENRMKQLKQIRQDNQIIKQLSLLNSKRKRLQQSSMRKIEMKRIMTSTNKNMHTNIIKTQLKNDEQEDVQPSYKLIKQKSISLPLIKSNKIIDATLIKPFNNTNINFQNKDTQFDKEQIKIAKLNYANIVRNENKSRIQIEQNKLFNNSKSKKTLHLRMKNQEAAMDEDFLMLKKVQETFRRKGIALQMNNLKKGLIYQQDIKQLKQFPGSVLISNPIYKRLPL